MNPETEFAKGPIATCDDTAFERIRRAAAESPRQRARLCLHSSVDEKLHEMIIVLRRGTVVAIHRHPEKEECYHSLSGFVTLRIHNDTGQIVQQVPLGPFGSGREFVCRISAGLWHSVIVESEEAAIHESTFGPMTPNGTEYLEEIRE